MEDANYLGAIDFCRCCVRRSSWTPSFNAIEPKEAVPSNCRREIYFEKNNVQRRSQLKSSWIEMIFSEGKKIIARMRAGDDERRAHIDVGPTEDSGAVARRICDFINVGLGDLPKQILDRLEISRRRALLMKKGGIKPSS